MRTIEELILRITEQILNISIDNTIRKVTIVVPSLCMFDFPRSLAWKKVWIERNSCPCYYFWGWKKINYPHSGPTLESRYFARCESKSFSEKQDKSFVLLKFSQNGLSVYWTRSWKVTYLIWSTETLSSLQLGNFKNNMEWSYPKLACKQRKRSSKVGAVRRINDY